MLAKVNIAAAVLFIFVLTGCGGGETTTTAGINDNIPQNSPEPAPDNGGSEPDPGNFAGTGTAALSWMPPSTYTDGSSFTDLAGHYIYMSDGSGFVKIGTLTNSSLSDYLVENLSIGTYTFVVTAYDSLGVESSFSNQATITISS